MKKALLHRRSACSALHRKSAFSARYILTQVSGAALSCRVEGNITKDISDRCALHLTASVGGRMDCKS